MKYAFLIFFFFVITSCENEVVSEKQTFVEPPFTAQLFNWSAMNNDGWKNMSFPNWFSKAVIDSNDVSVITIDFINYNFTDSLVRMTDTLPHKNITTSFDQFGNVEKIVITESIDGIQLAEDFFSYQMPANELGYSAPVVSSNVMFREKSMVSFFNTIQELQQYQRLVQEDSELEGVLKFLDKSNINKTQHYFLVDSSNWNVSFIDNNYSPDGDNVFYFGSPKKYTAAFSLKNLVEKTMKQTRAYYPNGVLKEQCFYTEDFITKRWFTYDETGLVHQFIDSLVTIDGLFLHREIGVVEFENSPPKFPEKIQFYRGEDSLRTAPIKSIRFEYK